MLPVSDASLICHALPPVPAMGIAVTLMQSSKLMTSKPLFLTSTTLNVLFNVSPHFHKQVFEFFDDLQVNVDERASVFFQALRNGRATIHAGNMF